MCRLKEVSSCGEYTGQPHWGQVLTHVTPYKELPDVQFVDVMAYINGSRKQISIKQIVECSNSLVSRITPTGLADFLV